VSYKPLRLKYFDGISNLTDSAKQSLTVGDLRDYKDQQISGTVVLGTRGLCILVSGEIEGEKVESTSDARGGDR
jgi:hypothetical protein